MTEPIARGVQEAFDAAVNGDVEPLVALLAEDVDWRGLERGRWLRTRVVDPNVTPEARIVWGSASVFIVRLSWQPIDEPGARSMFQVLRFEAAKIREMADYRTLALATRTAKRFADRAV